MNNITYLIVPLILVLTAVYSLYKKVEVFPVFISGAKKGLQTAIGLLPTLVALITAVYMLRASGFIDVMGHWLSPIFSILGIPEECSPLVLLKPMSGSGGLALGTEIIKQFGVDSYQGRVAAVMLAASETSLYTISIYLGHLGINKSRYAIPSALIGDLTAFIMAAYFVRILF